MDLHIPEGLQPHEYIMLQMLTDLQREVSDIKKCIGDMREHLSETYRTKDDCNRMRNECSAGKHNRVAIAIAGVSALAAVCAVVVAIIQS